jgi:hypothetical protein
VGTRSQGDQQHRVVDEARPACAAGVELPTPRGEGAPSPGAGQAHQALP